jgi:murein DD-endopeptidase MepM/ murein hydrolase activator NlpD
MPVQAVLSGVAASVITDRFPYGNAVLIETPLDHLPEAWLQTLNLPQPLPQSLVNPALTCPTIADPFPPSTQRSLYLLYAHLQTLPLVEPEQSVTCAQPLGAVGDSGNALNPHLHLEVRVGPSGARFASLAHYDNRASPDEMGAYCLWRVSGVFQLVDPLLLLALEP